MHIMEGLLPVKHAISWTLPSALFVAYAIYSIKRSIAANPEQRILLGVAAAFFFVLSALKLQSVTGNCSHPTGTLPFLRLDPVTQKATFRCLLEELKAAGCALLLVRHDKALATKMARRTLTLTPMVQPR